MPPRPGRAAIDRCRVSHGSRLKMLEQSIKADILLNHTVESDLRFRFGRSWQPEWSRSCRAEVDPNPRASSAKMSRWVVLSLKCIVKP